MHYVGLKLGNRFTPEEANSVKGIELLTPEKRWPDDIDALREVYFRGDMSACIKFIEGIDSVELRNQLEIYEV